MKNCYLGIDPAFRKDGFAVCIIDEQKEVGFKIFRSFLDFLDWIEEAPDNAIVCIENSNLQNRTFDMRGSKAEVAAKSRNVGTNQAASQYTVDACRKRWGKNQVFEISPKQKGKKWTNAQFRAVFKAEGHRLAPGSYKSRIQDKRDAYQLALKGKTIFSLQLTAF